jgi:outer membrane protein TolC
VRRVTRYRNLLAVALLFAAAIRLRAAEPIELVPAPPADYQVERLPTFQNPEALKGQAAMGLTTAEPDSLDRPLPINLATALRLSDARPLVIAAAQASAIVASAQLDRANVLWVPSLNLGAYYYRHDGGAQVVQTGNMASNSRQEFIGGGGLTATFATTDAFYEPLAARQVLQSRQMAVQAARNDALLAVAEAYFSVQEARGRYTGMLDTAERARKLSDQVHALSRGLTPPVEVDRVRTLLAEVEQQTTIAQRDWRVSSANLTRLLRLDPRAVIVPLEQDHLQVSIIGPEQPVDELIPVGLTNRPELGSQQALVQATIARLKQERMRPLIPSILLTGNNTPGDYFMGGVYGDGPNGALNQWASRSDVSLQFLWQLENLGLGNSARIRERAGQQRQAIIELFTVQDRVAAEVAQAHAVLIAAAQRTVQAEMGLKEALISYEGNTKGLRQTIRFGDVLQLVNRPQEVVSALMQLEQAYTLYFSTVADYNRAQFGLYHALGYPAQTIACGRPMGDIIPIDTSRPCPLPPVCGPAPCMHCR